MTPCVECDGDVARDDDGACVGCGFYPPVQLDIYDVLAMVEEEDAG